MRHEWRTAVKPELAMRNSIANTNRPMGKYVFLLVKVSAIYSEQVNV
jgi:hypothetical protein